MKKLPSNLIAQAKLKCLTVVTELEQQHLETPVDTVKNHSLSINSASTSASYSHQSSHLTLEPHYSSNSINSDLQYYNDYNQYYTKAPISTLSQYQIEKRHGDVRGEEDIAKYHNL